MVTLEDFIKAMHSYTSIYNEQTWSGHMKREYPDDALNALYNVYKDGFQRGFHQEDSDADDVAVYMVDVWAFMTKAKLREMFKDGFESFGVEFSIDDIEIKLGDSDALHSCEGGYILNLETFEKSFPHYERYTDETLVTQCDYLH